MRGRRAMAPASNRFEKMNSKERSSDGCCFHQELIAPGCSWAQKQQWVWGSMLPAATSRFPHKDQFSSTIRIRNFPASSHARKKQENSVQGGNLLQEKLPAASAAHWCCSMSTKYPSFLDLMDLASQKWAMLFLQLLENSGFWNSLFFFFLGNACSQHIPFLTVRITVNGELGGTGNTQVQLSPFTDWF